MRTVKCVCFDCRLCFHNRFGTPCPSCQGPLRSVGAFFRAPRRHRVKAWKRIEKCIQHRTETTALLVFPKGPKSGKALRAEARRAADARRFLRAQRICEDCGRTFKRFVPVAHRLQCRTELLLRRKATTPIGETISMALKEAIDYEGWKRKVFRVSLDRELRPVNSAFIPSTVGGMNQEKT